MEVGQLQFKFSLPSHPPHPLQIPLSCLHQHTTRLQLNHWLTAAIKASIFGRKCSPINKQIIIFSREPAKGRNTKNLRHTVLINVAENPQNWLTESVPLWTLCLCESVTESWFCSYLVSQNHQTRCCAIEAEPGYGLKPVFMAASIASSPSSPS